MECLYDPWLCRYVRDVICTTNIAASHVSPAQSNKERSSADPSQPSQIEDGLVIFKRSRRAQAPTLHDRTHIRRVQNAQDLTQSLTGSRTVARTGTCTSTPSSADSRTMARATSHATRAARSHAIRRSAHSPQRASRGYAARRRRCSNRRERSPVPAAVANVSTQRPGWAEFILPRTRKRRAHLPQGPPCSRAPAARCSVLARP